MVSHYVVAGSKNPLPLGMGSVNVSHINKHSFKDYLHILSLTNKYKNQPVIAKTAFLEDLGLEAQSIYKEIQAIAKGTPE